MAKPTSPALVIDAVGLRKTYFGGRPLEVLHGIDLRIAAGEFVAICMGAVPRLVSSRTVSRDARGAIGSAGEALTTAMRALSASLDADQGARRTGGL